VHPARDHALPPDPELFRQTRHPHGRLIIIAPTRAACETIELALRTRVDTLLEREHGAALREWARRGIGFGIVAGTGVGKTLGVRPIAEEILQAPLRVGVVNREREATPETPEQNVVIVTTGIARRWFQDDLITKRDALVIDEIHQTSAELELCLALGKRAGCRFIWLSATVDPTFYAQYLGAEEVLVTRAFDPALKAKVEIVKAKPEEFFDDRTIRRFIREQRGVAVFLPTRAEVEKLGAELGASWDALSTAFYHGGEPIRVIRPFLEGEVNRPFLLAMTAAGQSALNVPGLDTVVIYDARYANKVERGRNVLHRLYLGANEILQMAGRVHGRVAGGEVVILSDRDLVFETLRPGPPEFQLAGDAERVAITCAAMGVDARDLDLPVPLDRTAYARAVDTLTRRGIIAGGRLTDYGREVEAMPTERPWAELLVKAEPELVPMVAVCASCESLHRMTREDRNLRGAQVGGSDHLTVYNLYAEALKECGSLGSVHGLPRHVFDEEALAEWCEARGVLVKAVEDAALGVASIYRALELKLPRHFPFAGRELRGRFCDLLAAVMPFDLVIDEKLPDGTEARIAKSSVAGAWGGVVGSVRWFADRFGQPRASIEGTTLSYELIRRHADWGPPRVEVTGPAKAPRLAVFRALVYGGFELETDVQPLDGPFPEELRTLAHEAIVEAIIAGRTLHPAQRDIRRAWHEADELFRRSGGTLAAIAPHELRARLRRQLESLRQYRDLPGVQLALVVESLVPGRELRRLRGLPDTVRIKGEPTMVRYEFGARGPVARLRLKEGVALRLRPEDLPTFDRPYAFAIIQSADDGDVLGDTLDDALAALRRRRRDSFDGRGRGGQGRGWRAAGRAGRGGGGRPEHGGERPGRGGDARGGSDGGDRGGRGGDDRGPRGGGHGRGGGGRSGGPGGRRGRR
jgi:hypothetical protein